jgi:hypothetical protein
MAIFKGDNTAAFGANFLTISVINPDLVKISKIVFVVNGGVIKKEWTDENYFQVAETTLIVNFNSEETKKLYATNIGNLVTYDEHGQQYTCPQYVSFNAREGVINNVKCCC